MVFRERLEIGFTFLGESYFRKGLFDDEISLFVKDHSVYWIGALYMLNSGLEI